MGIQYNRILLKVSGEALSGPKGTGFDEATIASICAGIRKRTNWVRRSASW